MLLFGRGAGEPLLAQKRFPRINPHHERNYMSTSRFALFVDLENCGAKVATLNNILEKVKIRGDILLGKVYGYTDHFRDLKEILLSNTFTVVPSLRHGVAQKNNADILLVLDALEVAYTNPLIDSFCIVSGDSDYTPLVGRLKSMGKFVLGISRSEVASNIFINACNEFQFLESVSSVSRDKRSKQNKNIQYFFHNFIRSGRFIRISYRMCVRKSYHFKRTEILGGNLTSNSAP